MQPLLVRRVLWQEYGVAANDLTMKDVILAVRLHNAEVARQNRELKELQKQRG